MKLGIAYLITLSFFATPLPSHSATITGYTPISSEIYEFSGSGFSSVTEVSYFGRSWVKLTSTDFSIISDSLIHVSTAGGSRFGIQSVDLLTFQTDTSMAVVFSQSWTNIDTTVDSNGSRLDLIQDGGYDRGIGGSSAAYIESGGRGKIQGAGSNLVFVESGASFSGFGGGSFNTLYHEPGADISLFGSGGSNTVVQIPTIDFYSVEPGITSTPDPSIPEPSTIILIPLGALLLMRGRCRSKLTRSKRHQALTRWKVKSRLYKQKLRELIRP